MKKTLCFIYKESWSPITLYSPCVGENKVLVIPKIHCDILPITEE